MLAEASSHEPTSAGAQAAITTLKIIRDGKVTRTVGLDKLCVSIGRASDNDISLDDNGVSRHHAQIITVNGETVIEDLGSRNGTFVNQKWVRTRRLQHGDSIVISRFRLVFSERAGLAHVPTVAELLNSWQRGFEQTDYDRCLAAAPPEGNDDNPGNGTVFV